MGFCLPNVVLSGYLDTRSYPSVPALQKGTYTPSLHLILILFLPSIGLCLFELGGGKAPFLATFDTKIFFLGFALIFSFLIQRAHRQRDMGMGIVSGRIWVMDDSIGAHSVCYKLLLDKILKELDLVLPAQFYGQRCQKFTVHGVPQGFPILAFCRGCGWQFGRNAALSSGSRRSRNSPRRAHVPDQRKSYHRLLKQVMSKYALRDKKEEGLRFPGNLPAAFNRALPAVMDLPPFLPNQHIPQHVGQLHSLLIVNGFLLELVGQVGNTVAVFLMEPVKRLLHGVSRPDDLRLHLVAYRHHQKSF